MYAYLLFDMIYDIILFWDFYLKIIFRGCALHLVQRRPRTVHHEVQGAWSNHQTQEHTQNNDYIRNKDTLSKL